ncbi:peptidoglycan-binding domain-containing protein [Nocardioides rubriscoriae]|uniref:peptidoglycan-binding domain-containing protein n=1 Tax=Nocardioides rubriscoriae TaxID=642762 RepID=UPI0011DFF1C6|nr:peptidoglycan-binding domain-containing protein [Nocardioides rubriscoriae]
MALIGADTEELREVGREFQEGKETTDQVIMFLRALIAILRAASFFSGGASLAYAEYLETTVVPWLQKISQALGLFATVLGAQADAQDEASNGGTVDYGSLPTYQSPALPAPVTPYQGEPIAGAPLGDATTSGSTGSTGTTTGPRLTVGADGHLMIDTGIDLDGDGAGVEAEPGTATPLGSHTVGGGPELGPRDLGPASAPTGGAHGLGHGSGIGGGIGGIGGGTAGGAGAGLEAGGPSGGETTLGTASIGGDPTSHSGPVADGGLGGAAPGAQSLGAGSPDAMGAAAPTGGPSDGGASYGAAAGIAGGAAALGLGGAALASRGGGGTDAAIDRLAASNGRGSRGEGVKELQERLTAAGYDTRGADGAWGAHTQAAYDAYRADHPLPVQLGQGYTSPTGYDYQQITGVRGNPHVTPEFLRQVEAMSQRLGARPEHLMAAMSFETGGQFSSDVRNPRSSATGLIQFMDSTARGLGTTTGELARMTPTEQLHYVERYFEPYRGRLGSLESVYTSILAGSPHAGDDALFTQGDRAYGPNRELDADHDGVITAAEATAHVRARMGAGGN